MASWRPIPDFESYEVSDAGQVRRYGKILKMQPRKLSAHLSVTLSKRGRKHRAYVHRLVLLAFVGHPPAGMEARHYPDRDPTNNSLSNLSWAWRGTNVRDRAEHETDNAGARHGVAKLTWNQVRAIRASSLSRKKIAEIYGVSPRAIDMILNNERWKHDPQNNL